MKDWIDKAKNKAQGLAKDVDFDGLSKKAQSMASTAAQSVKEASSTVKNSSIKSNNLESENMDDPYAYCAQLLPLINEKLDKNFAELQEIKESLNLIATKFSQLSADDET